jgi:hypothetical protein
MNYEPTLNCPTFQVLNHRMIESSTMCLRLERGTRGAAKPNWEIQQHVITFRSLYKNISFKKLNHVVHAGGEVIQSVLHFGYNA